MVQVSALEEHRAWKLVTPAHYVSAHNFNTTAQTIWKSKKKRKKEINHSFIRWFLYLNICWARSMWQKPEKFKCLQRTMDSFTKSLIFVFPELYSRVLYPHLIGEKMEVQKS